MPPAKGEDDHMKKVLNKPRQSMPISSEERETNRLKEGLKIIMSNSMGKGTQKGKRGATEADFDEVAKQVEVVEQPKWQKAKSKSKKRRSSMLDNKSSGKDRKEKMDENQSEESMETSENENEYENITTQEEKNDEEESIMPVGEKERRECNKERTSQLGKETEKREIYWNYKGHLRMDSEMDATEKNTLRKERFEEDETGPYKVIVKLDKKRANTKRGKNLIIIMKELIRKNIRPTDISMNSFTTAEVKFVCQRDANHCLDSIKNDKEENGLIAYIDFRNATCKGVVSDWPDSIKELWEVMTEQKEVVKMERIHRKKWNNETKKLEEEKTENMITFKGNGIKKSIGIWENSIAIKVRPYVAPVLQMFQIWPYQNPM